MMNSTRRMTEDRRLIKNIVLLILVTVLLISQASADTQTHSREEIKRFTDARSQLVMAESTEQRLDGILALENFRAEFSQTFLKGDASEAMFAAYSNVVDDPQFLLRLAEEAIALLPNRNGLYKHVVQTFVDKGIYPDRTLMYAQKSLKLAENMQTEAGDYYEREVIERLGLLSQAYQLVNRSDKAVAAMKRSLEKAIALPPLAYPDQATRQNTVDGIGLDLLRLYVDQSRWDAAFVLACDLLKISVIREPVYELWSTAYVGKFGSAEGIIYAYADLKAEIEESRKARLIEDRVKRPAPAFKLKTLTDETGEPGWA